MEGWRYPGDDDVGVGHGAVGREAPADPAGGVGEHQRIEAQRVGRAAGVARHGPVEEIASRRAVLVQHLQLVLVVAGHERGRGGGGGAQQCRATGAWSLVLERRHQRHGHEHHHRRLGE